MHEAKGRGHPPNGQVIGARYLEGHGRTDTPAIVSWDQDPTVSPETAPAVEPVESATFPFWQFSFI
jgi:hypothetical protein